jgi:hypothetical protein
MQEVTYVQYSLNDPLNELEEGLRFYPLEGLLPVGQALSVNTTYLVISLIARNSANGNPILRQKLLTEPQMRLLLPLLQSPHYCPHQVLYASLSCSYRGLLAGLFSSNSTSTKEWTVTLEESRVRMQRAYELGIRKRELKQLYNTLSQLRIKLRSFGLAIAVSITESAYTLVPLPHHEVNIHGL